MKKMFTFLLSGLIIFSLSACSSSSSKEESPAMETTESSGKDTDMSNPWIEYDTLDEAESAAGFEYSFKDTIVNGSYQAEEYRAMDGMLEITYYKEDSTEPEDQYVIRQAKKTTEDISGDYNSYSHDFTVDDCGIDEIRLRGSKDFLSVCSFDYGEYSYVIYPGSMDYTETFVVISELTGTPSTEFPADSEDDISDDNTSDENPSASLEQFIGEWNCEDSYLEDQDKESYTGFYALSISESGEFSLYDAEAGNPGIAGTMNVDSDSEITVTCDEEDFDPPAGWSGMSETQTLQYEFADDEELHLIYRVDDVTSTLVFHKEEEE